MFKVIQILSTELFLQIFLVLIKGYGRLQGLVRESIQKVFHTP